MCNSIRTGAVALALVVSLSGRAAAQSGDVVVPTGYRAAPSLALAPATPLAPRSRLSQLDDEDRAHGATPRTRLLRSALRLNLDEERVLSLDDAGRARAIAELDAIDGERGVSFGLGMAAVVSGAGAVLLGIVTVILAAVPHLSCDPSAIFCDVSGSGFNPVLVDIGFGVGGLAVALAATSIAVAVDTGARRGRWAAQVRAGGFATDDGYRASLGLDGSF